MKVDRPMWQPSFRLNYSSWATFLLFLSIFICLLQSERLSAQTLERTVELRDGTLLQVKIADQEIPWRNVSRAGIVSEHPVQLSEVKRIVFSESPATVQVAEVRRLLNLLGSGNFAEREQAQSTLIKNGGQFKDIIKQYQTDDREILWRLDEINEKIEDSVGEVIQNQFDSLTLVGQEDVLDGDSGGWKLEVEYAGVNFSFDRQSVREIHDQKPILEFADDAGVKSVVRLTEDDRPQVDGGPIKAGYTRIDFDLDAAGNSVSTKQRLNELYLAKGCRFSSEITDSYISAYRYNCKGVSGNFSAGVSYPAYEGVIRIDFCIPGKPNFPAAVKFVGFYISLVAQDGTQLEAYNGNGQQIAAVKTTAAGSEFLGIRSSESIAFLRIVPQEGIDKDFAIDDLYFDTPRPLVEGGDPTLNTVVLKSGDRLQATSISIQAGRVTMSELTFTDQSLQFSLDDVAVFTPRKAETLPAVEKTFVQLKNGDTLAVNIAQDKITAPRFSDESIALDQAVAIWSKQGQLPLPADVEIPSNGAVIMLPEGPLSLSQFELGETWVASKDLDDRADLKFSYGDSPAIYLQKKPDLPKRTGVIRMVNGETFWLGEQTAVQIKSLTGQALEIERHEKITNIPLTEVNSIRFPQN